MGFVDKQILPSDDTDLINGYSRTVADAVERVGPAVSRIGRVGHGSRLAISPGGLIVTNNHVLENAQRVGIKTPTVIAGFGRVVGAAPMRTLRLCAPRPASAHLVAQNDRNGELK